MTVVNRPADSVSSSDADPADAEPADADGEGRVGSTPPPSDGRGGWWRRLVSRWGLELGVVAASAVVYGWDLGGNRVGNAYYAASVRSMNASATNFLFASFDPGGWVTVDKPPMSQWMAALSVWVFGWSAWTLLLPSVLCGVASVGLLMATVRRAWGRTAGLAAGVALSATPAILAVSRSNNPDVLLVLWCVASAWAVQAALTDGRLRWMLLAGLFAGFGFLTKSLAVGTVLPGLWVAYLVAAPGPLRRRVVHCLAGGLVFLTVACAWMGAVALTPLSRRPWIGGSRDGGAWDLVFGYNGFGRISGGDAGNPFGQGPPRGGGPGGGGPGGLFAGPGGVDPFGGATGIGRLFNAGMGDQVMWLVPLAVAAALGGFVVALRARRRDPRVGSLVMWVGWGALTYPTLAFAGGIVHNYYVCVLAPAVAALVGIGLQLVREARRWGWAAAAVALGVTAGLQVVLLGRVDAWEVLRRAVPIGVALAAAVVALAVLRRSGSRRVALGALAAGSAVVGVAPAVWALAGVREPGNGLFPEARPASEPGFAAMAAMFGGGRLPDDQAQWLRSQLDGERWMVAVGSAMEAQANIIDGDSVVALGGFMGTDPANSVERVAQAVDDGELRFVLAGGGFPGATGSSAAVAAACAEVDPGAWSSSGGQPGGGAGPFGAGALYDCAGRGDALRANADAEPASGTGGFPGRP